MKMPILSGDAAASDPPARRGCYPQANALPLSLAVLYTASDPARILVAPANVAAIEAGTQLLGRVQATVRLAGTAAELLSVAAAWPPAAVVVGSELADLSISELCATLRRRDEVRDSLRPPAPAAMGQSAAGGLPSSSSVSRQPRGVGVVVVSRDARAAERVPMTVSAHLMAPVVAEAIAATLGALLDPPDGDRGRVPLRVLASIDGLATDSEVDTHLLANTLEVGEQTLLIEASQPLELGRAGSVRFFVPGGGGRLSLGARVHHAVDEVRHHYLLELLSLAAADRRRLDAYHRRMEAQA